MIDEIRFTFLLLHQFGIRKLEAFFASLIIIMLVCFCLNLAQGTGLDTIAVTHGFLPTIPQPYATTQAVGILGAVIMPHNIFLHSGLVRLTCFFRLNHFIRYKPEPSTARTQIKYAKPTSISQSKQV